MKETHLVNPEKRTHYHLRHGTISLVAAKKVATPKVIGKSFCRHQTKKLIRFHNTIDACAIGVNLILRKSLDNRELGNVIRELLDRFKDTR